MSEGEREREEREIEKEREREEGGRKERDLWLKTNRFRRVFVLRKSLLN